ncbi:MAG: hypothetical protein KGP12_05800 [Actinomycetales bacterium]|nr:hypothetical protein [Actinomycetales bacterium]
MAILWDLNTRTYKFALGQALLHLARQGRDAAAIEDLAVPYALAMAQHAATAPQVGGNGDLGQADYLTVLAHESAETLASGHPTERLIDASARSMPAMVMQKFHNLPGDS